MCGLAFGVYFFVRYGIAYTKCATAFGTCVWANVPIKTYFPDGMFGVMECDVSGVEHLAVHKCLPLNITKSFESFTSLKTITLGSASWRKFPRPLLTLMSSHSLAHIVGRLPLAHILDTLMPQPSIIATASARF